jgi:hypothetical protein
MRIIEEKAREMILMALKDTSRGMIKEQEKEEKKNKDNST